MGGVQKMSVFVHAQGIKTVHARGGGGGQKWQNSVHVVIECPLIKFDKDSRDDEAWKPHGWP